MTPGQSDIVILYLQQLSLSSNPKVTDDELRQHGWSGAGEVRPREVNRPVVLGRGTPSRVQGHCRMQV